MLKKIIILFLVSLFYQINVCPMNLERPFYYIIDNSVTNCIKCNCLLKESGVCSAYMFCSNSRCKQIYRIKNTPSGDNSNLSDEDSTPSGDNFISLDEDNKKIEPTISNKPTNVTFVLLNCDDQKFSKKPLLEVKRYLITAVIFLCIACKYHKQIKKFLFGR